MPRENPVLAVLALGAAFPRLMLAAAHKQMANAKGRKHKPRSRQVLKAAFEQHIAETGVEVERLEQIFAPIDETSKGKTSDAIMAIIEAGKDVMKLFADGFPGGGLSGELPPSDGNERIGQP